MVQHYQDNLGVWHELPCQELEYLLHKNFPGLTFTPKTQAEYDAAVNPPKTAAQITQDAFKAIELAIDKHIDDVASVRGYGRVGIQPSASCLGYASYPNPWQAEAIKFGQWVSACQVVSIQAQADILAGKRTIPTPDAAILELPAMVW